MIMVSVIVVAAGKGSRMKSSVNKQFLKLKGKAVLQHTIEIFLEVEEIDEMVVVLSKEDVALFQSLDFLGKEKVKIALGGQERYFSVRNGLEQVSEDSDVILVHDGARPFVTKEEIKSVISCARQDGACILATKVKDTIKGRVWGCCEHTKTGPSLCSTDASGVSRRNLKRSLCNGFLHIR